MSPSFNNFDIELINNIISEEELQKLLKDYYNIDNLEKPLKAFGSYKLDDLINISNKLNINIYDEHGKKRKKQDLYTNILQKIG